MEQTTSTEFMEWQAYLDKVATEPTQDHFYLAQIAAEVFRGNAKHPRRVRLRDFLLKFTKAVQTPEARAAASKAFWLRSLGLGKDGKPRGD